MEFYPYQMNQTLAAKYCGISVSEFKKEYRPYLRKREKGGFIFFLKPDLEKHIRNLFNEKVSRSATNNNALRQAKPKQTKKDAFEASLANLS